MPNQPETTVGAAPAIPITPAVRRAAAELMVSASLEIGAHRPQDAAAVAELLPTGTSVFVNHLPRHSLTDTLAGVRAVHAVGLEPVPHLAARRIPSEADLARFLEDASKLGVHRVLVIGGDVASPIGPYTDAVALIASGILTKFSVREVGVAAYPESHPRIEHSLLARAFAEKLALLRTQGLGAFALTQFTFNPQRSIGLCVELDRHHPELPVYVGLPGPTTLPNLVRFAQICGVGASFRALETLGRGAIGLVTKTDPSDQLCHLAHYSISGAIPNVVGVHMFTFGGVAATAGFMNRWIRAAE